MLKFFKKKLKTIKKYKIRRNYNKKNIYLDAMENSYMNRKRILKKMVSKIKNISDYNRYNNQKDIEKIKKIIKHHYFCYNKSSDVLIGNGSDEIILLLIMCVENNVGSFSPSFSMYKKHSLSANKKFYDVKLNKNFDIDYKLTNKIIKNKNLSLFFISYPNNPTGNFFCKKKISSLVKNNKSCLFVIDEAYFDFSRKTLTGYLEKFKNLAILRTLSKLGFAGLRIGFILSSIKIIKFIEKIKCPYNINVFSLKLISTIISFIKKNILKVNRIIEERNRIFNILDKIKLKYFKSKGNFFIVKINTKIKNLLREKNIKFKRFKNGRLKSFIRISIGNPCENNNLINCFKNEKF